MAKQTKTTKKKKGSVSIHLRVKPGTAEWLESQTDDDRPSRPEVVRDIVEAKRREDEKRRTNG